MNVILSRRAVRDLENQLNFLIDAGSKRTAQRLEIRVSEFLERTLARFPRTGTFIGERELWESWVPGTRLVVWYRVTANELQVVRFWNTSQDRQHSND